MRRTALAAWSFIPLFMLLLLVGTGLTACTPQVAPTPNVEELARQLVSVWATQTAVAAGAAVTPTGAGAVLTPAGVSQGPSAEPAPGATTQGPSPTADPTVSTPAQQPATSTQAPVATPLPSSVRTAGPSATFAAPCPILTKPELASGWDRAALGCPTSDAAVIWAAWEPFERGAMFWRSDQDQIYALNFAYGADTAQGSATTAGEPWRWDGSFPEGRGLTPPPGFYEPVRGFGMVWSEKLGGPTGRLGWATQPERGICVTLQQFERGIVVKSSTVARCQDDLYNNASEPSFKPVFLAIGDDGRWRRY